MQSNCIENKSGIEHLIHKHEEVTCNGEKRELPTFHSNILHVVVVCYSEAKMWQLIFSQSQEDDLKN